MNPCFILIILIFISCKNKDVEHKGLQSVISSKNSEKIIRNNKINNLKLIEELHFNNFLNNEIVETNKWLTGVNTIFVFETQKNVESLEENIEGFVYIFENNRTYKKVKIDTYEPEGRNANVEFFFFYNVDKDTEKELVVLCSWEQQLKAVAEGKLYQVFIYDNYVKGSNELVPLIEFNNLFGIEFEGVQEGRKVTAKFKSIKSIKKKLNQIFN